MSVASTGVWRCRVCGYLHRGDQAPEECPVCGAATDEFEAIPDPAAAAAAPKKRWRCAVCTHEYEAEAPPKECPVCGAATDQFEAVTVAIEVAVAQAPGRIVVVGAGIAGLAAAEAARQAAPQADVILLAKEPELPYYRLNLTRFLAGDVTAEHLPIHPASWYTEHRIGLETGVEVATLLPAEHAVVLRDGRRVTFDRLVLATGAHPFLPPFPGLRREGVVALRKVGDALSILAVARPGTTAVGIGGGILGLEIAGALARQGVAVTLLEDQGWLMPRQLDQTAGELLKQHLQRLGIQLRTRVKATELLGDERVTAVTLDDKTTLPADLVVIATGVRANCQVARRAGLNVNQAVVVDDRLATSHPDVFAAGDVCEHRGGLYGNWSAAQFQGSIAGLNAAGATAAFGGIPRSHKLKVLGIDLVSIGKFMPDDGSCQVLAEERGGNYYRLVFREQMLIGAILLGDGAAAGAVKKAIEGRTSFASLLATRPEAADVAAELAAGTSG